jgi:phosphatidylglycerophosphate synthase
MVDRYLRSSKDLILDAVSKRLPRISPTAVTFTAFAVGLVACVATWRGYYLWGLGFWLANRILDGLDGSLARHYAKQTDLGGYLDIMLDFVIYAVLPLSLVLSHSTQAGFTALAILLISFYINAGSWMYLSAILEKRTHVRQQLSLTSVVMPRGLIEGAETIVFYCLFLLFPQQLVWLFILMAVLVLITAGQRVLWATRTL